MPGPTVAALLTQEAKAALATFVKDQFTRVARDAYDYTRDYPAFLAGPNASTPNFRVGQAVGRAACRSYARGNGLQNSPAFEGAWSGICAPYLDSIGENPGDGSLEAPFTGGQCEGVTYRIDRQNRRDDGTFDEFFIGNVTGPISRMTAVRNGPGTILQTISSASGTQTETINANAIFTSFTFTTARFDGQPDVCGDPEPEFTPPPVPPGLPPIGPVTVDVPGIGPVNIDATFNPDGSLNIALPDLGVEVNVPNPFDSDGDGGTGDDGEGGPGDGGAGGTPPPGDVGTPGAPTESAPGGESEGAAPEGQVLVGLRVEVLSFPGDRSKLTNAVYRGAYYAYMGVPGLLDLDFAGAAVRLDQFLFAEKDNLTAWRVSANRGYTTRVTPYYREPI